MKDRKNTSPAGSAPRNEPEIETKQNQCCNCKHWFKYPETSPSQLRPIAIDVQGGTWGDCRRYPPVIAGSHPGFQLQLQGRLGHFPATISSNSCGEYVKVSS